MCEPLLQARFAELLFAVSLALLLLSSCCVEEAVPSHLACTSPKAFTGQLGHHVIVKAIISALKCILGI